MSALSDSYVARVLFATHRPAGALDAIARRWRWLRDPYRARAALYAETRPEMAREARALATSRSA
jgi:hypothetical protein